MAAVLPSEEVSSISGTYSNIKSFAQLIMIGLMWTTSCKNQVTRYGFGSTSFTPSKGAMYYSVIQ